MFTDRAFTSLVVMPSGKISISLMARTTWFMLRQRLMALAFGGCIQCPTKPDKADDGFDPDLWNQTRASCQKALLLGDISIVLVRITRSREKYP